MFPGATTALPFLPFLTGCSEQISLYFLKVEHFLSAVALHTLGQVSCNTFQLSYIFFTQIQTVACMEVYSLTINKSMRNRNFYQ